ncbi:MAG: hypothetical protein ACLPVY_25890 [Acidimicrobiia bacterium]
MMGDPDHRRAPRNLADAATATPSTSEGERHDPVSDTHGQPPPRQSLREWLIDAMHAGDRLAVTIVEQRFTGTVDEVGDDLLALRAIFGRIDLHLLEGIPLHIELVEHAASGGRRGETARSFAAVLAARDPAGDTSVGTVSHPDGLDGQVTAGSDFVITTARAGAVTVIPLAQVAWVCDRRT